MRKITDPITRLFIGHSVSVIGVKGIPAGFSGSSGVEEYLERRAVKLAREGIRVRCYVRTWATPRSLQAHHGITLIHIPTINTKYLDASVHSFIASVHVCFSSSDTVWYQSIGPAVFSVLPKIFGKRIVVTVHGLDWQRQKWKGVPAAILRAAESVMVHVADDLVVVSPGIQKHYYVTYGKPALVDELTIDRPPAVPPDVIRRKYGLRGGDFVLFMGRFVPEKRIEWLIDSFITLKPAGVKLVVAGSSSHTDTYERLLRKKINTAPGIIYTGYVRGREKQELLQHCGLFVLPSSLEGNPVVLKELPSGKPVLVGNSVRPVVTGLRVTGFVDSSRHDFHVQLQRLLRHVFI